MGSAKREMERLEACRHAAVAIAMKVDLVVVCPNCGDVKDPGSYDYEAAYRFGNWLISRDDAVAEPFAGDRREMTDAVLAVVREAVDECRCEYLFRKDDERFTHQVAGLR